MPRRKKSENSPISAEKKAKTKRTAQKKSAFISANNESAAKGKVSLSVRVNMREKVATVNGDERKPQDYQASNMKETENARDKTTARETVIQKKIDEVYQKYESPSPSIKRNRVRDLDENSREKIMWASVITVMLVVLFVWASNLGNILAPSGTQADMPQDDLAWEDIAEQFDKSFAETKQSIEELKALQTATTTAGTQDETATNALTERTEEATTEEQAIEDMRIKLEAATAATTSQAHE